MELNLNPWEIAKGGWLAAVAVVAWVGRKHLNEDRERFTRVEDSVGEGLKALGERLATVSDQMDRNHADILKILIEQNRAAVDVAAALAVHSKP